MASCILRLRWRNWKGTTNELEIRKNKEDRFRIGLLPKIKIRGSTQQLSFMCRVISHCLEEVGYSPTDRHLSRFQSGAIMNKTSINICVHLIFLLTRTSFFWTKTVLALSRFLMSADKSELPCPVSLRGNGVCVTHSDSGWPWRTHHHFGLASKQQGRWQKQKKIHLPSNRTWELASRKPDLAHRCVLLSLSGV